MLELPADVSQPDAVAAMFQQIDAAWGGLDVLVNNAGVDGSRAMSWETDPEAFNRVLHINLFGAFLCAREALKRMVAQRRGVIINTSSVHEVIAWSGYSAYAASKAGLSMMSRTMAQEAGAYGVRVLCVAPGAIRTPINARSGRTRPGSRTCSARSPSGGSASRRTWPAWQWCSRPDVAGYVTGSSVFVDGGMTDYPAFSHGG